MFVVENEGRVFNGWNGAFNVNWSVISRGKTYQCAVFPDYEEARMVAERCCGVVIHVRQLAESARANVYVAPDEYAPRLPPDVPKAD